MFVVVVESLCVRSLEHFDRSEAVLFRVLVQREVFIDELAALTLIEVHKLVFVEHLDGAGRLLRQVHLPVVRIRDS